MTIDRRDTAPDDGDGPVRSLFWVSVGFYVLIAFEFFYMASPFAAYFYAVYGPGMDGLEASGLAGWTLWFFLPHIVADTRSSLVNHAGAIGAALFLGGLVVFAIGAFRVYRAKLRGRGAVTGGLYAVIRHPQYAALIVASVGMLLVWPRFLVLFATATVVFAYVLLARAEESICLHRFSDYAVYRERTGMFVPRSWTAPAARIRGWLDEPSGASPDLDRRVLSHARRRDGSRLRRAPPRDRVALHASDGRRRLPLDRACHRRRPRSNRPHRERCAGSPDDTRSVGR